MPSKAPSARKSPETAETFLASLDHPFKEEIVALRRIILDTDPAITEEIKWNAPSFRTSEHFATVHLRAKEGVQIILHRGAKKREHPGRMTIDDPEAMLAWLGDDRASVLFRSLEEIESRRTEFTDIIRQWIGYI